MAPIRTPPNTELIRFRAQRHAEWHGCQRDPAQIPSCELHSVPFSLASDPPRPIARGLPAEPPFRQAAKSRAYLKIHRAEAECTLRKCKICKRYP